MIVWGRLAVTKTCFAILFRNFSKQLHCIVSWLKQILAIGFPTGHKWSLIHNNPKLIIGLSETWVQYRGCAHRGKDWVLFVILSILAIEMIKLGYIRFRRKNSPSPLELQQFFIENLIHDYLKLRKRHNFEQDINYFALNFILKILKMIRW